MQWIVATIIAAYGLTIVITILLVVRAALAFRRNPVPTFVWLSVVAFFTSLAALFEILSINSHSGVASNLFIRLAYESFAIMTIFIILFSESYVSHKTRIWRIGIMLFIAGVYTCAFSSSSVMEVKCKEFNLYDYSSNNYQLSILAIITFIIVTFWILQSFVFAYKKVSKKEDKVRIIIMSLGFVFSTIFTPVIKELWFQVFTKNHYIQAIMAGVVANVFLAVGVTMLIVPYLQVSSIQFLLPQNYYFLIVVNDAGLLLWEYKFEKHKQIETVLLSAALIAIRSLLQEATGVESPLKSIQFRDITFVVSIKGPIAGILVLDHGSQYIERQLNIFTERFYLTFKDRIARNSWEINGKVAEQARSLMKNAMLID